ncbi:hypothetical protein [Stieleria neptunia]|uniref:hypothetical protein n=1 Tax=Stieleria neptunia TaxID=2527979 RepID=UPI0011A76FCD|nr:hypothetical protein [Stieleria neptunia]
MDNYSSWIALHLGRFDPLVFRWGVFLFAIQGALHFALLSAQPLGFPPIPDDLLLIATVGSLFGVPFVYFLPTAKADGMAKHWRVPKRTLILSRPLARLICSGVVGIAIGGAIVAPFVELTLLPIIIAHILMAVAVIIAMRRRFACHPCTEWTMPPPGYQLYMPLVRGTRPDA